MAIPGNRHCANCIGTLSFPLTVPSVQLTYMPNDRITQYHFTCIGALGTPSRTGLSLESIYRVSLAVDLCEG